MWVVLCLPTALGHYCLFHSPYTQCFTSRLFLSSSRQKVHCHARVQYSSFRCSHSTSLMVRHKVRKRHALSILLPVTVDPQKVPLPFCRCSHFVSQSGRRGRNARFWSVLLVVFALSKPPSLAPSPHQIRPYCTPRTFSRQQYAHRIRQSPGIQTR